LADVCWIGDFNHRHKHDLALYYHYSSQKLGLPLTAVTSLLSINALTALAASIIAGSLVDHFGRKGS